MTLQDRALSATRRHRETNGHEILNEFAELLALPNISADHDDIERAAHHIASMLQRRRVEARVVSREGAGALVVGHLKAERPRGRIGIYAHFDGQPIDQPDWETEPFKPTLFSADHRTGGTEIPFPHHGDQIDPEWRIYARSASDDKAPVVAVVAALDALANDQIDLENDIVFLFEGEEEIGSPHLPDYLEQLGDDVAADVWLICDGPVHQTRRPQVVFGVRGISEMEITVYGPVRPLHSGHYGNWAPNPNLELARLLSSMKDDTGRVAIANFYDSTQPITPEDMAAIAELPDDDAALQAELGLGFVEGSGEPLAQRLLRPSLNIRGLDGGAVGATAANVIPVSATASIDIRLAAGNDPVEMMQLVADHIRLQGWHVVEEDPSLDVRRAHQRVAKVEMKANYPGVRLPTSSPLAEVIVAAASAAAEEKAYAVPTFGGSVPIHYFTTIVGSPIAITPFANHDNNQHAANENIRVANLWYGIDLMAALMTMELPNVPR